VELRSGEQHWETIPDGDGILNSQLSTTIFDWEKWWVIGTTNRGDMVLAEVSSPLTGDPTKGRPIVYLDQGHWSTVAQVIVNPDLVRKKSEIEPALEFRSLQR
jgi:hypothetical protein